MELFGKKKEPEKKKRELPGLAKGVLHKEPLSSPVHVPESLPQVLPKKVPDKAPEKLPDHLFSHEDRPSFFSEHVEYVEQPAHESDEEKSFFIDLAKHLSAEEKIFEKEKKNELAQRNFVGEMKEYWASQRASMNNLKQNKQLESEVMERVEELRRLENDWQRLETQMDETRQELMEKERLIEEESRKLKQLMKKWSLKKDAKIGNYFFLTGGQECKNVPELAYALRKMSDQDFEKHVQFGRNDFANWIRDVFQDHELANDIEMHHDKTKIIELLDKTLA